MDPGPGSQLSSFISDEALTGGQRLLTISTTPLQYQAKDGAWLPVDPRFISAENGFTNFTNALRISAAEEVAILNVAYEDAHLQWQPQELAWTGPNGEQIRLASVLDPLAAASGVLTDDHQSVRYAHSWSDARLVEYVTARPGSVEQTLIIASAFDLPASHSNRTGSETLSLFATLRLQPGMALYAGGALQSGAFTTTGEVEIRSRGKSTLVLAPVLAYEQENPAVNVRGSYQFNPQGEGIWEVVVQTPWDWWSAGQRHYPVVLDPTMKILGPVTTAQICDNYPSSACPVTGYIDPKNGSEALYIGHGTTWGIIEALVRFDNLPTLPPGYVIQQADLLIAPDNPPGPLGEKMVPKTIRVNQVTTAWNPATVNYNYNRPKIATPHLDQKALYIGAKPAIPVAATSFVSRFHLQTGPTGLVTDWLTGMQPNNGLLLYQYPANNCLSCQDAVKIYTAPLWAKDDLRRLDPENPYTASASEGSGMMLQITYSPPTLQLNHPIYTSLPSFGEIYADTYHAYLPPVSSSTWTATAVKGLHQVQTLDGTVDQAAGNLRMARGCLDPFAANCAVKVSEGDFKERPNFILTRGNPAATSQEVWLYPPNPNSPANAALDEYQVDAIPSANLQGNPTFSPGTHITRTVVMSTAEIMQLYNVNLVNQSRLGVKVHATATDPATGYPTDMPYIEARLFKPVATGETMVKDLDGLFLGGHTAPGIYEMGKAKIGASQGGTWALALEYFGDVDPTLGEPPITYTTPLTMTLEMVFVACASNAVPSEAGCFTATKPTSTTPFKDVGSFRVFNEAGFSCNEPGTGCHTVIQPGPNATLPAIVWKADWIAGQQDRWVTVANAPIYFDTSTFPMYFSTVGNTWLAYDPGSGVELLEMFTGVTMGYPDVSNPADPTYARLIPLGTAVYASPPLSASDAVNLQIDVHVRDQAAFATTHIERQVQAGPGSLSSFSFDLSWTVRAEGYSNISNKNLSVTSIPSTAELASLTVVFGSAWDMDYTGVYQPNGRFTNLRGLAGYHGDGGVGARIAAPASLGSNWKGVTVLLLPVGENLPDSDSGCSGDCLDVRAAADTPSAPNRTWELPDLNITGQAQTLFFNKPGELAVLSTDHPNSVDAVSMPFSFRTFKGQVNVDVKVCPNSGSSEKVVVISGQSQIALPGLGSDSNPSTMIGAGFILCETSLREVSLEFNGPPDLPVGSTGVWVDYVKGGVLIGPANTQITIDLTYHDNSDIVDGAAKVTINTAGLFDMQTSGDVLAKVHYNGHAWVSWNPLDVGVDVHAWYSSWLQGDVYAHLWKGQGWQNKYSWLPNDNATHFAGSITAGIAIDAGQAFSWAFIEIPPWDITFDITVAFGQFCKSSGCSSNEWGIKGKFEVIGYDVGFFYGFSSGFHFILGSDGHVLIDQYKTVQAAGSAAASMAAAPTSAAKPLALERYAVADPLAAQVEHPLTVTPFTGSFMAGLTWSQGAPALTLVRPDLVEITPANAASYGISVVTSDAATLYGVPSPLVGTWKARITNTAALNDYHFAWFANKAIPDIETLSPSGVVNLAANNTSYNIQWDVPPLLPPNVDLRISLFYTTTNSTEPDPTQTPGGVIRENLPLTDGSYSWDLSSLAYGDYHVYARVYSGQPGNDAVQPEPSTTGTDQIPGDLWVHAPGVIHLVDYAAPSTPTGFGLVPVENGFLGCWSHNPEKDLSGYVIQYTSPDVFGVDRTHELRLHAEVSEPNTWMQCARLGGFNNGEFITAQIAAYDASGNLSAFSDLVEGVASSRTPDGPDDPGELAVVVVTTNQVELSWEPTSLPPGGGVWLSWSRARPLGVRQVEPPVDLGDTHTFTMTLLDPGWVYFFQVQNHDEWARLSSPSNMAAALVSDGVDRDRNGLPDDWEAAYGVDEPSRDEDGDGLDNSSEFQHLTGPRQRDTDGDGFLDGTEIAGGSDPLDANSTAAALENYESGLLPLPELSVDPSHLTFRAYTQGSNPPPQAASVLNLGGGDLNAVVSDDADWLQANLGGTELTVLAYKDRLAAGHYQATITVAGAAGSYTQNSPQTISVDFWLLEGPPPGVKKMYLPLVER